jgi:gliding motility-associated-like protein
VIKSSNSFAFTSRTKMKHFCYSVLILLSSIGAASAQTLALVKDITTTGFGDSFPRHLTVLNDKLYFSLSTVPGKLFVSDGTTAGTIEIGPSSGNGTIWGLTPFNGELYFAYDDGVHGEEIWKSNGTTAGTVLLKDLNTGSTGSNPKYFTVCNGKLFFQASTLTRSEGLWVTDGTTAGTIAFNVYASPISTSIGSGYPSFQVFNNRIYFSGNIGSGYGLWTSDGTLAGTQLVKSGYNSSYSWVVHNNKMYFGFDDNAGNNGLWVSDGTTAGTTFVKTLINPHDLFSAHNQIYFSSFDNTTGDELWISDGTSAGTIMVKDIVPGTASSTFRNIFLYKNEVYFFAYTGEFYKTDGTASGTIQITGAGNYPRDRPLEFNGKLYWAGDAGNLSGILYESDGTSVGTKAILPQIYAYSNPGIITVYKSEIYLSAYYGSQGVELCKIVFESNTLSITSQPLSKAVCAGVRASFTTVATGTTNLIYQWQKSDGAAFNNISNSTTYTGVTTSSLTISSTDNNTIGTYRCKISGDNTLDVFTNSVTLSLLSCTQNSPPVISPTSTSATLQGTATIDLLSIITDVDNNLNPASLSVIQAPLSGAAASINQNRVLTINYSGIAFSGQDRLRIEACDFSGSCVQQEIIIDVTGDIKIYNAVSPNGDNKNDFFFIQYIDVLESTRKNNVTIFNRWGDVVFEVTDYNNTDKVFKGLSNSDKELVTGTYYYKIAFTSGRASKTGFLYLKR